MDYIWLNRCLNKWKIMKNVEELEEENIINHSYHISISEMVSFSHPSERKRKNWFIVFWINSVYILSFYCFRFPLFSSLNHHWSSRNDVTLIGMIFIDDDGMCHPSYSSSHPSQWHHSNKLRENKDQEVNDHRNQHHENIVKQTKNTIIVKKDKNQLICFVFDFLILFYINLLSSENSEQTEPCRWSSWWQQAKWDDDDEVRKKLIQSSSIDISRWQQKINSCWWHNDDDVNKNDDDDRRQSDNIITSDHNDNQSIIMMISSDDEMMLKWEWHYHHHCHHSWWRDDLSQQ